MGSTGDASWRKLFEGQGRRLERPLEIPFFSMPALDELRGGDDGEEAAEGVTNDAAVDSAEALLLPELQRLTHLGHCKVDDVMAWFEHYTQEERKEAGLEPAAKTELCVSKAVFHRVLTQIADHGPSALQTARAKLLRRAAIRTLFHLFDSNSDGAVEYRELLSGLNRGP